VPEEIILLNLSSDKFIKVSMKNDMLDFNVIIFFSINIHNSKVLHPLPVK